MRDSDEPTLALLLAEFEQLKAEQSRRIGTRDNLVYAGLVSVAAVGAFALTSAAADVIALLALPVASLALGWLFAANDKMISAIGDYVAGPLRTRALAIAPIVDGNHFAWEEYHRNRPDRWRTKVMQMGSNLLVFVIPGASALALAGIRDWHNLWVLSIGAIEALALAALGLVFISQSALLVPTERASQSSPKAKVTA